MVILVVEDEGPINLMTSEELRRAGHRVISAYSADQAIAILESRNDIRLVFTDIDMPGSMDGLKLAAAVRDRWPPVQILITSGKHPVAALPEGMPFLPKPYRMDNLCRTVEAFSLF
jgi:DNA-binding NtrC family response regulator